MDIKMILLLLSALFWTIVYIDGARIGMKQKTYAIPFWALALNFNWEALHSYFRVKDIGFDPQSYVNIVWMLLDVFILYTYFKYGKKYLSENVSKKQFVIWSVLGFITSFVVEYMFIYEFGALKGGAYAAFLQNLIMSVLFIDMLRLRNSSEGQSLLIAWCKFLGTLAPIVFFGVIGNKNFNNEPNVLIFWVGCLIVVFDLIYIFQLTKIKQKEK